MKLNLNKPLVFFDLETTGLNIGTDRIIEISLLKVNVDGATEQKTWRVNPEIPIPKSISELIGIVDEDVKNCPTFKEIAPHILQFMSNADLAGYNSIKFDVPLFVEEMLRVGVEFDLKNRKLIDVQHIYHVMEPRNLSAAYRFYCSKNLVNAHSAAADTLATYEILMAQLEKYQDAEISDEKGNKYKPVINDVTSLSKITINKNRNVDLAGRIVYNEKNIPVFNFGKHKDKPVTEVFEKEPGYYNWIMNGDFPLYTKRIVTQIRLGMKKQAD